MIYGGSRGRARSDVTGIADHHRPVESWTCVRCGETVPVWRSPCGNCGCSNAIENHPPDEPMEAT